MASGAPPHRLVSTARPPLIPPTDPRRLARQIRVTGQVVLLASLLTAGWLAWTEWRRTEPTIEEVLPGSEAAEARQMGEMNGLFARDLWNVWMEVRRPYPSAVLIAGTGLLVFWGCIRLARRHEADAAQS